MSTLSREQYWEQLRKLDERLNYQGNDPERDIVRAMRGRLYNTYNDVYGSPPGTSSANPTNPQQPSQSPGSRWPNFGIPNFSSAPGVTNGLLNNNPLTTAPRGAGGILNAAFAAVSIPANLREGWERGNSGAFGNPVFGAINAVGEVAGSFIPAYAWAEFASDLIFDAAIPGLSNTLGFSGGTSEELSRDTPNTSYTAQGSGPFEGGQCAVMYNVSASGTYTFQNNTTQNWRSPNSGTVALQGPLTTTSFNCNGVSLPRVANFQGGGSIGPSCLGNIKSVTFNASISRADGQSDNCGNLPGEWGQEQVPAPTRLNSPGTETPQFEDLPFSSPFNFNPFDFISLAPPSPLNAPTNQTGQSAEIPNAEESNDGRPGQVFNPFENPFIIPLPRRVDGPRPDANQQTGSPSRESSKTEQCNPGCVNPGVNATNQSKNEILDRLKDIAGNTPELIGLGGLAAALASLINKVNAVGDAIGLDAFPISVPASINQCDLRAGKSLNNLAESQLWQVEQLDSVMGQWCNSIEIETPAGKQNLEVRDMSDAVTEILGMLAAQSINSGVTQNAVVRTLIETGAVKQQAFLAHQYSKGNAEFLGYESQRSDVSMPLTFNPGGGLVEGLLNSGAAKVLGFENTSKRDFNDILAELLQAAAIIRSVYWRRLNPKEDMKEQIKDVIGRQANFSEAEKAREDKLSEDDPEYKDDWSRYLEAVENAFGPGAANNPYDTITPYGRDFNQRPKLVNKKPPDGVS